MTTITDCDCNLCITHAICLGLLKDNCTEEIIRRINQTAVTIFRVDVTPLQKRCSIFRQFLENSERDEIVLFISKFLKIEKQKIGKIVTRTFCDDGLFDIDKVTIITKPEIYKKNEM